METKEYSNFPYIEENRVYCFDKFQDENIIQYPNKTQKA